MSLRVYVEHLSIRVYVDHQLQFLLSEYMCLRVYVEYQSTQSICRTYTLKLIYPEHIPLNSYTLKLIYSGDIEYQSTQSICRTSQYKGSVYMV